MHKNSIGLIVVLYHRNDDDIDPFSRGSFFTCKHFTPVKTSLRIWWIRNTPVTKPQRHLLGPILWHATAHTPARVLGPAGGIVAGFLASSKTRRVSVRCSDALYTDLSWAWQAAARRV
jgi:hypothetical protein